MKLAIPCAFLCFVSLASAYYYRPCPRGLGANGWVYGYGFNAFPGINNGVYNGYADAAILLLILTHALSSTGITDLMD